VVVNNIEDDGEAERMGFIHERPQILWRSVESSRGEEIDAVIAPAIFAREIGDRHHLNHRDPDSRQLR
jgi:hypothetical protein